MPYAYNLMLDYDYYDSQSFIRDPNITLKCDHKVANHNLYFIVENCCSLEVSVE